MASFHTGVIAGKFLPFHKGHAYVIEEALKMCETVHVLLIKQENEAWSPIDRAFAIYDHFIGKRVQVHIVDDIYTDDSKPESHQLWADYTFEILGFYPSAVFGSEEYNEGWATAMRAIYFAVDPKRAVFPISGTLCRKKIADQTKWLPPETLKFTVPRIVVTGAESSGTTTLAGDLARKYGTQVVPEYGRTVAERAAKAGKPIGDSDWTDGLFWLISRGQDAAENRAAKWAKTCLICDTDSLSTAAWYKRFGTGDQYFPLWEAGIEQARKHSFYVVTSLLPFEQDENGTRRDGIHRQHMQNDLILSIRSTGIPFVVIEGNREERLNLAMRAIDNVLDNPVT